MSNLPGYDEWKTASPYYMTAEEEADLIAKDHAEQQEFRDAIAAALADARGDVYLADIREIVIQELNKLQPQPGEPKWQTKTPVPMPKMG